MYGKGGIYSGVGTSVGLGKASWTMRCMMYRGGQSAAGFARMGKGPRDSQGWVTCRRISKWGEAVWTQSVAGIAGMDEALWTKAPRDVHEWATTP